MLVPPKPFLVEGSLQMNLDHFGVHEAPALLQALEFFGLYLSLDKSFGRGGGQLLAGQRQLSAMARATLSRARIVVMDEPNANCDARTGALLQEVLHAVPSAVEQC
mmetsp:Transcript_72123/g.194365  ORF Transcript_72123/g.194365 Transcript_72123/m.194365 type:complete len:106 (+) Transcript_72123:183-500(+)